MFGIFEKLIHGTIPTKIQQASLDVLKNSTLITPAPLSETIQSEAGFNYISPQNFADDVDRVQRVGLAMNSARTLAADCTNEPHSEPYGKKYLDKPPKQSSELDIIAKRSGSAFNDSANFYFQSKNAYLHPVFKTQKTKRMDELIRFDALNPLEVVLWVTVNNGFIQPRGWLERKVQYDGQISWREFGFMFDENGNIGKAEKHGYLIHIFERSMLDRYFGQWDQGFYSALDIAYNRSVVENAMLCVGWQGGRAAVLHDPDNQNTEDLKNIDGTVIRKSLWTNLNEFAASVKSGKPFAWLVLRMTGQNPSIEFPDISAPIDHKAYLESKKDDYAHIRELMGIPIGRVYGMAKAGMNSTKYEMELRQYNSKDCPNNSRIIFDPVNAMLPYCGNLQKAFRDDSGLELKATIYQPERELEINTALRDDFTAGILTQNEVRKDKGFEPIEEDLNENLNENEKEVENGNEDNRNGTDEKDIK